MPVDFILLGSRFPTTRGSAVGAIASEDPAERAVALETLVRAYWRPVYAHVRLRWRRSAEDARDVTQGFFARAIENRQLGSYAPDQSRFRTYLRAALDHYVTDLARHEGRQKRGGGVSSLSLDFDGAEEAIAIDGSLAAHEATAIDAHFDREWKRSLFAAALAALETTTARQGKEIYFEVFRRYVLEPELSLAAPPSYADIARDCSITVTDVTNYLSWTRRELRARVIDELRAITVNDEELRDEARAMLGIEVD